MNPWKNKKFINVGQHSDFDVENLYSPLWEKVFDNTTSIMYNEDAHGYVEKDFDFFSQKLKNDFELREIYNGDSWRLFINNDSILKLSICNKNIDFYGYSLDNKLLLNIKKFISDNITPRPMRGKVFVIVNDHGLQLRELGVAGAPLQEINYSKQVIIDYNQMIEDLQSSSPSGRIAILEGSPGSGKTYLVRSILNKVPDAMFIMVSPQLVASLSGPELLPLFVANKSAYAPNAPMILILEDADQCLVSRKESNMSAIQSLLNLGDGILGSFLDLRIVATTNARKLDIEPAILRPGRLSKRIEVDHLNNQEIKNIFKNLCPEHVESHGYPGSILNQEKMLLAEIYLEARNYGWKPKQ